MVNYICMYVCMYVYMYIIATMVITPATLENLHNEIGAKQKKKKKKKMWNEKNILNIYQTLV